MLILLSSFSVLHSFGRVRSRAQHFLFWGGRTWRKGEVSEGVCYRLVKLTDVKWARQLSRTLGISIHAKDWIFLGNFFFSVTSLLIVSKEKMTPAIRSRKVVCRLWKLGLAQFLFDVEKGKFHFSRSCFSADGGGGGSRAFVLEQVPATHGTGFYRDKRPHLDEY